MPEETQKTLPETITLYDTNPYESQFEAVVLSCSGNQDGTFSVILDQTQFFPEQGGQTPDPGILDGQNVLDVQIAAGIIRHIVKDPISSGKKICGEIDYTHRFSFMQQHTGEHIFSGLVHEKFGYSNVGFHLSDATVTMDYDGVLTDEDVRELEKEANRVIAKNLPVTASFPSDEELKEIPYRSKKELEGQIRLVTIPGVDICACCAPHVAATGCIGVLKVLSCISYKGGVRLTIACGERALKILNETYDLSCRLAAGFSTGISELEGMVEREKQENLELRGRLAKAGEVQLLLQMEKIPKESRSVILQIETDLKSEESHSALFYQVAVSEIPSDILLRDRINELVLTHEGVCGVLVPSENGSCRFIFASEHLDMRELAGELREKLQARGGGSRKMIQGSIPELFTNEEKKSALAGCLESFGAV